MVTKKKIQFSRVILNLDSAFYLRCRGFTFQTQISADSITAYSFSVTWACFKGSFSFMTVSDWEPVGACWCLNRMSTFWLCVVVFVEFFCLFKASHCTTISNKFYLTTFVFILNWFQFCTIYRITTRHNFKMLLRLQKILVCFVLSYIKTKF